MSLQLGTLREYYTEKAKEFGCKEKGCECQRVWADAIKGSKELIDAACCAEKVYPGTASSLFAAPLSLFLLLSPLSLSLSLSLSSLVSLSLPWSLHPPPPPPSLSHVSTQITRVRDSREIGIFAPHPSV